MHDTNKYKREEYVLRINRVLDHIDAKYKRARYAGRSAAASTATGLLSRHLEEQKALVGEALTG